MKTAEDLKKLYIAETGNPWNDKPDMDYILWLEGYALQDKPQKEEIEELVTEGIDLMVKLLPPEEYGESYDCERLQNIINELGELATPSPVPVTPTKEEVVKVMKDSAKIWNDDEGAHIQMLFDETATAILSLFHPHTHNTDSKPK